MTMLEIYKGRKQNLIRRIKESKSLYETGSVICELFETMQYQYLARNTDKTFESKVMDIISFAKTSFPLVESVKNYRITEEVNGRQTKKKSLLPGFVAFLLGMAMVFVPLGYYMFLQAIKFSEMKSYMTIMLFGCFEILFSGFLLFFRRKHKAKNDIEIYADREDIANRIEDIVKSIDQLLNKEKDYALRQEKRMRQAINRDELTLFSYLMEARMSGRPDFALEQLEEVEHYLVKQDVILVNYTKGNEKYFDFLEGEETKTIRPAFVRGGEILKKGLAQISNGEHQSPAL